LFDMRCSKPFVLLTLLVGTPPSRAKWRTQPSAYRSPSTFDNVCIGRDDADSPPNIYFAAPPIMNTPRDSIHGDPPPAEISLGTPTPTGSLSLGSGFKLHFPVDKNNEPKSARVVMTADESPHAMASQVYLRTSDGDNMSEPIDVHYVGGVTVLMHTPCDLLADNFFNTLTEEGPMLHRAVERARAQVKSHGRASRVSLLLENRCPHHSYRDELRDMLIGRDHAVWKVLPSTWTCAERLITPPPAPLKLEGSLREYVKTLRFVAEDQHRVNRALRHSAVEPIRTVCTTPADGSEPRCRILDEGTSTVGAHSEPNRGLDPPMRVVVVQRTAKERRIANLDKLLNELKRKLSTANFTDDAADKSFIGAAGKRAIPFVELLVRRATVEVMYFEGLELYEQIMRMKGISIFIGVTGSGMTNLAFLEPGSMVIELSSVAYEQNYFDTLIMRAHGSLLRGTITYRKSYGRPVMPADGEVRKGMQTKPQVQGDQHFDLVANVTDVSKLVMEELQYRARGWWRGSDV